MICLPITDSSLVAEARRNVVKVCESIGLDPSTCARVALVVTELGTNLLKHAGGGMVLVGRDEYAREPVLEILALDRGVGMRSLRECMQDGYSTTGSPGTGLGAIARQSHTLDIFSAPDVGTAIYVRAQIGRVPEDKRANAEPFGAVSLPKSGEIQNGDAWSAAGSEGLRTYLVVDGLGHGVLAAEAAQAAAAEFRRCSDAPPTEILANIHRVLRPTRGAAVSVARTEEGRDVLVFAGIGNVTGAILTGGEVRKMVSRNGTAGHHVQRIQAYEYPFKVGSHLVMYSDGLVSTWSTERYPGLMSHHPTLIAGVLSRDFRRERDDVTVLVAARETS